MKLKPIRYSRGRQAYWVVRVGKRLSGRRARKHYFKSRNKATGFVANLADARERLGQSAFALTLDQQAEAMRAFERLKPLEISLTSVVDHYLSTNGNGKPCPLFKDFAESFLAARRKTCTRHTLASYRSELKPAIKEFGKVPLNHIHQSDIEEWAPDLDFAPRTIGNILDTLTTVLNDAIRKELLTRNPAAFVPRPKPDPSPPGILKPEQADSLLRAAKRLRPRLVRPLAIALFAGLRRSEVCSLTGRNLLLKEGLIEVPAAIAKTRQRRLVTIRENLALWLAGAPRDEAPLAVTTNPDVFGAWVHELALEAGVLDWPHNCMRHSFASYLLALIHHEGLVAAEMGNTPGVVIRHYRAVVRPAAARAYFGIVPPGSPRRPKGRRRA
jgi:integrase